MRVYEFAKELGKDAGDFLEELNGNFGFEIKSHLSGISKEQIEQVRTTYGKKLLSSLVDLKDELEKQVDDSHKQDLKETFNETIDLKETEEPEKTGEWTLGSGDTIPPEVKLDKKAIEELKKENEKAVQSSIESAEKATKEYAKTVKNIVENPDDWSNTSKQKEPEFISYDLKKDNEESKMESETKRIKEVIEEKSPDTFSDADIKIKIKNQEVIVEKPSWFSRIFSWWSNN